MFATFLRLIDIPLGAWAFAVRNWIAMMLALLVGFWLQLDGASSAAVTVGILSLQTRGQVLQKAAYRVVGTIVGVAAAIVFAGAFAQTRYLFIFACALWLGVCATLASMLDGTRAYAAILSGYTVAIVALPNIDTPLMTFTSGINRGAAIAVGIFASAVVNDLLWAPDLTSAIAVRLARLEGRIRSLSVEMLRAGVSPLAEIAALMREMAALHPDLSALTAESLAGQARAGAALGAVVAMSREVSAARVATTSLVHAGAAGAQLRADLVSDIENGEYDAIRRRSVATMATHDVSSDEAIAAAACLLMAEQRNLATEALDAMRKGCEPKRTPGLHLYRSRRVALQNGLRAFICLIGTALVLSLLGWPATITTVLFTGVLVGLSTINTDPRAFATAALIAMPIATTAAGITEFLILDGADQFAVLVLGMGPTVLAASLLLSSSSPVPKLLGFLLIVYFPVILTPANPQSYNPQSYILQSLFLMMASTALFLLLPVVLPGSPSQKRRWMFDSARRELADAIAGRRRPFDVTACSFRDYDRIGQLGSVAAPGKQGEEDLRRLFHMSSLASCARRIRTALNDNRLFDGVRETLSKCLASGDPESLRSWGRALLLDSDDLAEALRVPVRRTAIDLLYAAELILHDRDTAGAEARS